MAVTLNKSSQVEVDNDAVGQLVSWDYSETDTQTDVTNFDSTRREFVNIGLLDGEANFEVQFDLADVGQDSLRSALSSGSATAIVIYPDGNTTGKPTLTGTIQVSSYSVTASGVEEVIMASFTGKLSALTEGTVA